MENHPDRRLMYELGQVPKINRRIKKVSEKRGMSLNLLFIRCSSGGDRELQLIYQIS